MSPQFPKLPFPGQRQPMRGGSGNYANDPRERVSRPKRRRPLSRRTIADTSAGQAAKPLLRRGSRRPATIGRRAIHKPFDGSIPRFRRGTFRQTPKLKIVQPKRACQRSST
jgi:hypothetical protein